MEMKTILCYGDSNTWGYIPGTGKRYPAQVRWPGVLKSALDAGYNIIEEGLSGRTTVFDDPLEPFKNGMEYLVPCLESHSPLDLVVLMLGSNDLKSRFSAPALNVAMGAGVLVDIILKSASGHDGEQPGVLLVAPPPISPVPGSEIDVDFEDGVKKSHSLAEYYHGISQEYNCGFLDSSQLISPSPVDGLHLEPEAHEELGLAVAGCIREILG